MPKIRIVLADDHAVLLAGMRLLINTQNDMEVVGVAADHDDAVRRCIELKPDILTLDMSMPVGNGIQAIQRVSRESPETRVLVLTMHDDPAYFRMAIASGAMGYLTKTAAESELLTAIRQIHLGRVYTQIALAKTAFPDSENPYGNNLSHGPIEALSEREREVLIGLAQGYTNQALADQLFLSVKTVESYRARLMAKLGMRSRAELTQFALEAGLLKSTTAT